MRQEREDGSVQEHIAPRDSDSKSLLSLVTRLARSSLGWDSLTYAALSVGSPLIAGPTDADVGADEVLALHLLFSTVVFALFTLILIWKECAA